MSTASPASSPSPRSSASLKLRYRAVAARRVGALMCLACVLGALLVVDIGTGPSPFPIADLVAGLFRPDALPLEQRVILWDVRLPYALMAVLVGASLGLAGAEMQTVLNNPLASPFTLGMSAAASVGASLVVISGWHVVLWNENIALSLGALQLFVEWLPKLDDRVSFDDAAIADWRAAWAPIVASGAAGASVMAHRDYHAENLIWLPRRNGAARVGMIDFQDAVRAHPSWDLHSLLQDARRDVSPALEAEALDRYFALRPGVDRAAFMADYAGLAALNQGRIIGIFARLIARDGKPRYRQFLPRMWRHLNANLEQPALAPVARWFDRHVPAEVRA